MPFPPIRQIGCIHFDDTSIMAPIATIKAAIADKDLSDALIVLPEASNVGSNACYYSAIVKFLFDINELKAISRECNAAFVAGLPEISRLGRKSYNAAYLIDAERIYRLSRKMHDDPKATWYKPVPHGDAQWIDYRGLKLTSLICQDAIEFAHAPNKPGKDADLYKHVITSLGSCDDKPPVLCVPARMTNYLPSQLAEWPEHINVVVGNVSTAQTRCGGTRLANRDWKPCLQGICLQPLHAGQPVTH